MAVFAGALKYAQYNWLKRFIMRPIAEKEGGATDTSQDYEYTDWQQVDAFAEAFHKRVAAGPRDTGSSSPTWLLMSDLPPYQSDPSSSLSRLDAGSRDDLVIRQSGCAQSDLGAPPSQP